jgi:tetratricopeptide (TPR) repeat protein
MKCKLKLTCHIPWRCLIIIPLIILVFGATSCDLVFPKSGKNLNKFIETYWGIDVTSPGAISLFILGAKTAGDKDVVDGLTAYQHCRSELYQDRGDSLLGQGDTAGARAQYEQALVWGSENTPHRASDKAGILYRYGNTYLKDVQNEPTMSKTWPLYRAAGQNILKAAQNEPDPANKAFYYRDAAFNLLAGGDKTTGKKAYDQAVKLDPKNPALENLDRLYKN